MKNFEEINKQTKKIRDDHVFEISQHIYERFIKMING